MPFFIGVKGNFKKHNFDYLNEGFRLRLDPTLPAGFRPFQYKMPSNFRRKGDKVHVIEVMTKDPVCLKPKDTVNTALRLFKQHDCHHLPILNKGSLVGMISDRDISWMEKFDLDKKNALDIVMSKTVLAVNEETLIKDVVKVLCHERISALPVLNKNFRLTGIVTNYDILSWTSENL